MSKKETIRHAKDLTDSDMLRYYGRMMRPLPKSIINNAVKSELEKEYLEALHGRGIRDITPAWMYPDMSITIDKDMRTYIDADVTATEFVMRTAQEKIDMYNRMKIKNVIFNDPATIVQWADGTKTVVKVDPSDVYDPEKGLAMAISKRALGDCGRYYEEFKKWLPEDTSHDDFDETNGNITLVPVENADQQISLRNGIIVAAQEAKDTIEKGISKLKKVFRDTSEKPILVPLADHCSLPELWDGKYWNCIKYAGTELFLSDKKLALVFNCWGKDNSVVEEQIRVEFSEAYDGTPNRRKHIAIANARVYRKQCNASIKIWREINIADSAIERLINMSDYDFKDDNETLWTDQVWARTRFNRKEISNASNTLVYHYLVPWAAICPNAPADGPLIFMRLKCPNDPSFDMNEVKVQYRENVMFTWTDIDLSFDTIKRLLIIANHNF